MKILSVSQKYLLCSLNERGNLPALSTEIPVCLLAGILIDLIFAKSVIVGEDKKLYIAGQLNSENQHLNSLYTFIKESKPMNVDKLASEYALTFTAKRMKLLIKDVGTSLINLGYASAENGGLFGNTLCFVPTNECVDHVVQNIRAELLENGTMSDDIIALVSLMEKSNQIKRYFSRYEKDQLKVRLQEIKNTNFSKMTKEMLNYIDTLIVVIAATSMSH